MSSQRIPTSLAQVPQEVLEHIAYYAATDTFLGPPSGIIPLVSLNRAMHNALSVTTNPHLYARIFVYKYDVAPAIRRMGVDTISASAMVEELQRRSVVLKRFRHRLDSKGEAPGPMLTEMLWAAYLMILESDGKNEEQLREYALMNHWLREFWFDPAGASRARTIIHEQRGWPESSEIMSLSLWLLWFLLRPEEYPQDDPLFREATGILKVIALGAHRYPVCVPEWQEWVPRQITHPPTTVRHYSTNLGVVAPAPASPAILTYLTLVNKISTWMMPPVNTMKDLFPPVSADAQFRSSIEWDSDWARIINLANPKSAVSSVPSGSFTPGSLEGVWEGIFTYTEFTSYAALLSGAPPSILHRSLVAQHRQTLKIQEWHLIEDEDSSLSSRPQPLAAGNPCRGYVPNDLAVRVVGDSLELTMPGATEPVVYRSWPSMELNGVKGKVRDTFLTGQGHSAWGQFSLVGRVRPCDGFISLSKEYNDGDRGKWLYRAYMVGNANGSLSGRWRDTLSPAHIQGYEGTWVASRRR
ncbi:hypothetical protein BDW22DRAFT_1362095 [Trametopsis cervina]|nr:hypothetical protein BDW22DRAFT_1362095 [Trametopsis cervina]